MDIIVSNTSGKVEAPNLFLQKAY